VPDFASHVRRLAAELHLELTSAGVPANPIVVLDLDRWREARPEYIRQAAGLVASALPITAGVLTGPPTPDLEPLITAASLTLASDAATSPRTSPRTNRSVGSHRSPDVFMKRPTDISRDIGRVEGRLEAGRRAIIDVDDVPGTPDLDQAGPAAAVERVREAALRSPAAAIACGQLVRQTAVLGTGEGLAAEAAAYSLLLGGAEFGRWLGERGTARPPAPAAEPVLVRRDGARLSIALNVPERRNAFSAAVREALLDAVLLAEADETIEAVELSGAGPAFCSGGDLDEFGTATDLVAAWLVRLSRAPWRVIDRIAPKVTVYAHGACVGAGTEIAAFAGRVVAAPDAFFALPEVRMGLVPGAGGSVSVVRRIGRWRAAWLMLSGERLPAATALRWGLVDEIAPPL
jgi:hypothetical protein